MKRDDIRAASRSGSDVSVPGMGSVKVRHLTSRDLTDREALKTAAGEEASEREKSAFILARVLLDDEGARLYRDDEISSLLGEIPLTGFNVLLSAVLKMNMLDVGKDAAEKN